MNAAFVVPFMFPTSTRFLNAVLRLEGARVGLISQDPPERFGPEVAGGRFEGGAHGVSCGGRDSQGHPVGSGVYCYRMEAGGYHATRSIVVQR